MSKPKRYPGDLNDLIKAGDWPKVLDLSVRRVKWLYENSNKNAKVIDEKTVRFMAHKLAEKIEELEKKVSKYYEEILRLQDRPTNI